MEYRELQVRYSKLLSEYNELVRMLNARGGKKFLYGDMNNNNTGNQFSQDDIKRLLLLCHPDKHGGKQIAVEITSKLLNMRK
jgi:hypothetical protein